jgi:hypothetical protein
MPKYIVSAKIKQKNFYIDGSWRKFVATHIVTAPDTDKAVELFKEEYNDDEYIIGTPSVFQELKF